MSKIYCPPLYVLPKIHKPGKSVRPIVSGINSPTYHLSRWLTNEFSMLPTPPESFSVKNSMEFIDKIKGLTLEDGEILISFDVTSLFPSVPVNITLKYLEELLVVNNIDKTKIKEYIKLTSLCMSQNCFQINNRFFEQHEGTAMGNSLSPFLANLFMSRFECDLKKENQFFPRIWLRYVDDVFAIFDTKKSKIEEFLETLNSCFSSVKFTFEKESNSLPFLNVLV